MSQSEEMTLVEHLGELRRRIIWVLAVFAVAVILGLVAAKPIINYLKDVPPANTIEWNVFSPWDALRIYMNFSFVIALVVSLPVTLYHIWAFVNPGLREEERKASLIYIPLAFLLFLSGLAFGYFVVFPMAFHFTTTLTRSLELTETYGISQYFSFMFNILIPLSLVFELPIVVMFLTKLRLLNPLRLKKMRKMAYMILVVVSTIITPPDAVSDLIVFFPMIFLYEFSVFLSKVVYRKQLARDMALEAEYGT
jgi:sec-independent protein translocase protein TatC